MRRRVRDIEVRMLPRDWPDALRQVLLVGVAYLGYELVRGLADGHDTGRAAANATRVIDLERRLHVFVEPGLQAWAAHRPWLMQVAGWVYLDAHGLVTFGALTFLYLRRNESFAFVRTMFVFAMAIALAGYAVYPTAPPRLMPGWGFTDPIRQLTGVDAERGPGSVLLNADAAIPSMHVCFALMIGWSMARVSRRRPLRVLWRLYPAAITVVVVVTGNHYLTDIALGAVTAAAAAAISGRRRGAAAAVLPGRALAEAGTPGRPPVP